MLCRYSSTRWQSRVHLWMLSSQNPARHSNKLVVYRCCVPFCHIGWAEYLFELFPLYSLSDLPGLQDICTHLPFFFIRFSSLCLYNLNSHLLNAEVLSVGLSLSHRHLKSIALLSKHGYRPCPAAPLSHTDDKQRPPRQSADTPCGLSVPGCLTIDMELR